MKKVLVFFVLTMVVLGSCSNKQKIVGEWTDIEGNSWVFSANGELSYENGRYSIHEYQYTISGSKLTITDENDHWDFTVQSYDISFSSDRKTLVLKGGKRSSWWETAGPGWDENRLIKN
jgi:hypothetical protein